MQVIEVRMCDQHKIDGWKIVNLNARLAQALENKKPAGEIGIDYNILAAHLQKEAGMTNKRDAHLAVRNEDWPVRFAGRRRHSRMAYQASKLRGTLAQRRIFKGLFEHHGIVSSRILTERKPRLQFRDNFGPHRSYFMSFP